MAQAWDSAPAATEELLLDRDGAVAVITLNRPERLNALTADIADELRGVLTELEQDPGVRAVVLTGAGRAFSSGADLKDAKGGDAEHILRDHYNPLAQTMVGLELPIVAAVNGVAAGAGASLAFACDLRVAAESAGFVLSFVNVGLIPDVGATWILPRLVGLGRAAELALLGEKVPAPEALTWGLVNRVVPDDKVLEEAMSMARRLASVSASVARAKAALWEGLDRDLTTQLEHEATVQGENQRGPDFEEARTAFTEKRAPRFAPRRPATKE